jgi:chemotaxis regulatin CheY-phosphate phosphatase CheZ
MEMNVDLRDQTEEIDVLNSRYRRALKDKVSVYDELVKAVKQLTDRNSSFMRNEIEICRLTNLASVTKKELEQKEKMAQEIEEKILQHEKGKNVRA